MIPGVRQRYGAGESPVLDGDSVLLDLCKRKRARADRTHKPKRTGSSPPPKPDESVACQGGQSVPSPLHLVWTQPRPSVFTFAVAMVLALVGVVWMAYHILYHGVPGSVPLYLLIAAVGGLFFIWIVCKFCVPISVYTEGDSVIITRSRVLLRIGLCTRHPIRDIRHIALDYQQTSDSEGSKRIRWSGISEQSRNRRT